jgi:murein DD-endopeptidase MepM/ murein hydrolase activator NlpD
VSRLAKVAALGCLIVGGCSADVSRFDSPFFGYNDSTVSQAPPRPAAGLGRSTSLSDEAPDPGASAPRSRTEVAALPEPVASPVVAPVSKAAPAKAAPVMTVAAPVTEGQTIEVQPGDTLYALSKRYGVSIADLQSVNGLQSPMLKPGQKLVLPATAKRVVPRTAGATTVASAEASAQLSSAPRATAPVALAPAAAVADPSGTHTVKPGDSLYAIAKANKVKVADLMRTNGIADARQLKPGTVLKMPGTSVASATPPPAVTPASVQPIKVSTVTPAPAGAAPAVAPVVPVASTVENTTQPLAGKPKILNGDGAAAAAPPAVTPTAAKTSGKFRWPVQGKVASGFGPRADGSNNDGLDILVPLGTEVLAAETGTVVYTGTGIPSFGNLVLLRHENGFVTAYAHTDQVLVKRGDTVKRGQAIAKAGKSGEVDQPMLHFEVRQGQTPVDPMPHMEKL